MMRAMVTVFEAAGFTVSERDGDHVLLQTRDLAYRVPLFTIEAGRQTYERTKTVSVPEHYQRRH